MILKNARHELFAQAIASGKSPTEAYSLAGYNPDAGNASHLRARNNVAQRITEILSAMSARTIKQANYTREWVVSQLIDNVERAKEARDFSSANAALRLLGIERAMFIDRKESGAPGEFAALETEADVIAAVRAALGDVAADAILAAMAARGAAEQSADVAPDVLRTADDTLQ